MIHLNKDMKASGVFRQRLIEIILPEIYQAATIRDFLENKGEIKSTKKILPLGAFYLNAAMIMVPWANCNILDEDYAKLVDLNEEVIVKIDEVFWGLPENQRNKLEECKRIYDVGLVYCLKRDETWLQMFKTHGPSIGESGKEKGFRGILNCLPNFG